MKLIDNNLYLELTEMVECGISENYLRKAKSSGTKCWDFINDPADNRKVLIGYEGLKPEYKEKVLVRFGNPYERVIRQPILEQVINRPEAYDFFASYRYNDKESLSIKTVNKYTRSDAWLTFLGGLKLGDIKKGFGVTVPEFYSNVGELIKTEVKRGKDEGYTGIQMLPGDFPSSYQRLKTKAEKYRELTFAELIDPMFGNKNSAKIGKYEGGFCPEIADKQMAVIRAVAAKHNNLDAGQVEGLVNMVFAKNGWETLSRERILQIMHENKALLTPGRRGRRAYNSEVAMQVKRKAPDFPTYYFTLDGWTVELVYRDGSTYDNRLVVVVVLDPMNKYPVGYAIGDRENAELIREANRNAILHLKELFGDYYRPNQLQSDNYALKTLTPFYQAVAHLHTPAAVGNAKSKVIEPYFKYLNKKYCQLQPNWSGHNITARKENQVNAEFLNLIKKSFPDRAAVERKIEQIISFERSQKIAEYLRKWEEMPTENRRTISEMEWLRVFGVAVGKTNKITGQGVVKTIEGQQYTYDSFEPLFRQNLHLDWQLFIDPMDMTRALAVSPNEKLQFVLNQKMEIPMDILSTTPEHQAVLKDIRDFNKNRTQEIIKRYADDAELVQEVLSNTPLALDDHQEAALKLMFTTNTGQQKERLQDAKRLGMVKAKMEKEEAKAADKEKATWKEQQMAYLKNKTDYSQYLD